MKPIFSLLRPLCLLAPLTLMACAGNTPQTGVVSRLSTPYVERQHQYRFASGATSLSTAERSRIHDFLSSQALQSGDVVLVTIPASGASRVDQGRAQTMRAALARVPGRVRILQDSSFGGRPTPRSQLGIIRVARAQGIEVDCTASFGDLGCANATNLATMIHEPGDILTPAVTGSSAGL